MARIGIKEKPKVIDVTRQAGTAESLTEARINCTTAEKVIQPQPVLASHNGVESNKELKIFKRGYSESKKSNP